MRLKDPTTLTREELEFRYAERQSEIVQSKLERAESVARSYGGDQEALKELRATATYAAVLADEAWRRYHRQLAARASMVLRDN